MGMCCSYENRKEVCIDNKTLSMTVLENAKSSPLPRQQCSNLTIDDDSSDVSSQVSNFLSPKTKLDIASGVFLKRN